MPFPHFQPKLPLLPHSYTPKKNPISNLSAYTRNRRGIINVIASWQCRAIYRRFLKIAVPSRWRHLLEAPKSRRKLKFGSQPPKRKPKLFSTLSTDNLPLDELLAVKMSGENGVHVRTRYRRRKLCADSHFPLVSAFCGPGQGVIVSRSIRFRFLV